MATQLTASVTRRQAYTDLELRLDETFVISRSTTAIMSKYSP